MLSAAQHQSVTFLNDHDHLALGKLLVSSTQSSITINYLYIKIYP